jgi:arylsulfatase A-like enzyme
MNDSLGRTAHMSVVALFMLGSAIAFQAVNSSAARAASKAEPAAPSSYKLDRTVLPIPEPKVSAITTFDARNVKAPPRFEVKAPAQAPNVMLIMIDDMGFGMSSAFGGPIHMPTIDRLAETGLRYNHFHTTALCSPTRTALLSGRNHHMNTMGGITEIATAFPGNTGSRPNNVAPLAEMLRLNGYSTGFFGKNHETAAWEVSPSGPTDRWPTRSGFDKFYGFIGGETNQWAPLLYDGLTQVELPNDPHYHFMTDMTNQAIHWMRYQKSLTPDKPFFMYFAPGATHGPHHVPKDWIAKYKGKFDGGWDQFREETWPARSNWVSSRQARSSPPNRKPSRIGTSSRIMKRNSLPVKWKSMPASGSTPTRRSAG